MDGEAFTVDPERKKFRACPLKSLTWLSGCAAKSVPHGGKVKGGLLTGQRPRLWVVGVLDEQFTVLVPIIVSPVAVLQVNSVLCVSCRLASLAVSCCRDMLLKERLGCSG